MALRRPGSTLRTNRSAPFSGNQLSSKQPDLLPRQRPSTNLPLKRLRYSHEKQPHSVDHSKELRGEESSDLENDSLVDDPQPQEPAGSFTSTLTHLPDHVEDVSDGPPPVRESLALG